jgi:ABC-type transporter Mla subunit MlaD
MEPTDVTIVVLREIRDEMRGMRAELSERIDQTNERLDAMEHRQTETEVRLATELAGVIAAVNEVRDLLRDNLLPTVKDHERRITSIESRIDSGQP